MLFSHFRAALEPGLRQDEVMTKPLISAPVDVNYVNTNWKRGVFDRVWATNVLSRLIWVSEIVNEDGTVFRAPTAVSYEPAALASNAAWAQKQLNYIDQHDGMAVQSIRGLRATNGPGQTLTAPASANWAAQMGVTEVISKQEADARVAKLAAQQADTAAKLTQPTLVPASTGGSVIEIPQSPVTSPEVYQATSRSMPRWLPWAGLGAAVLLLAVSRR